MLSDKHFFSIPVRIPIIKFYLSPKPKIEKLQNNFKIAKKKCTLYLRVTLFNPMQSIFGATSQNTK